MIFDDFDSPDLGIGWTASNFSSGGPAYDLAVIPGSLRINVPGGQPYDQWVGLDNSPEITRSDMNSGSFAIETRLALDSFVEGSAFTAGLAVRFGPGDLLLWGPTVGAFRLEAVRSGTPNLAVFLGWPSAEVFLRIEKSGTVFSFFHKAAAEDRWVADGQYRPNGNATVQSVGFGIKTWGDDGAAVTASFDYFRCVIGTNAPDIGMETGDINTFYNACTRWVPEHGPLISIPPNIPGQDVSQKNTRIVIPDWIAYDRTDLVDRAPQLYRIDVDGTEWSLETVVTMIYSEPSIANAGLFVQFSAEDALTFGLQGGTSLRLYRTGLGTLLTIGGFNNCVWLRITRSEGTYTFEYKTSGAGSWTTATTLAESASPEKAGVIAMTGAPAHAAFDFGYLRLAKPDPTQAPMTPPLSLPPAPPAVELPTSDQDATTPVDGVMTLENAELALRVDATTGDILQICNKVAGIDLLDPDSSRRPAWKIETAPGSAETAWLTPARADAAFTGTQYPDLLDMAWVCPNGLTVHAVASFDSDSDDLVFSVEVTNTGTVQVATVEYPSIDQVTALGGAGTDNYLLHPYATGYLFKNPLQLFPQGGQAPPLPAQSGGIPPCPYPEGYSGASTQIMAYYAQGVGGFAFWADDSTGWAKWLDCFRGDDLLTIRFLHSATGIGAGNGLALPYTVRVTALREGVWHEAAERYRAWAKSQPFCALGPLHSRVDRPIWLLEEVGLATFGINTQYDRQPWLQYFHDLIGAPVFHVTGPN
ncbi:MAG: hypothetical protein LBG11_02580, partial [Bifidobacteriaceae bacterium]|nr:hypothetical protein [Bifidobacteriaceae bacterium]